MVVTDPDPERPGRFPAYRCGVELLRAVHDCFGDVFCWRDAPYEFVGDRPAIDLLTGGSELRRALETSRGLEEWIDSWREEDARFEEERRPVLLYA